MKMQKTVVLTGALLITPVLAGIQNAMAVPLPGGTLDPLSIPKYVSPLVVPPEMPKSPKTKRTDPDYQIAVRQFKQQILPAGFPATTVWSYGREGDPTPTVAPSLGSTFNYPAFTIENTQNRKTKIRWINELVDENGNYLPHLFANAIDQTLHWANPAMDCIDGMPRTDCRGSSQQPYYGPVPMIPHVHGAHVGPESDGYPEAWWMPAANDLPSDYATNGTLFDDITGTNPGNLGYADFQYKNRQNETTLWYHDHSLGMTRQNVYAGPAGFFLIRGKEGKSKEEDLNLPGPAPRIGSRQGNKPFNLEPGLPAAASGNYHEIPIVIQDRSFNEDGSLFYPANRAFFEGLGDGEDNDNLSAGLDMNYVPDSDIAPIWNPEAFFNVMVVNGVAWPHLNVDNSRYRFRLLDGCNSRFLNLAMFVVNPDGSLGKEVPFYQIGSEGGLLPHVVRVKTGFKTALNSKAIKKALLKTVEGALEGKNIPFPDKPAADPQEALLVAPAERADVIVDFTGMPVGTRVRMINTAPDAPYGGFPDDAADPDTTGQIMEFVVTRNARKDYSAPVYELKMPKRINLQVSKDPVTGMKLPPRKLSLNEEESEEICALFNLDGTITQLYGVLPSDPACADAGGEAFAPKAALLGTVDPAGNSLPQLWSDPLTQNPALGTTEMWELHNFTEDAHPIHVHLVQYQVVNREDALTGAVRPPEPTEAGWKDTVIAYPGEITRMKIKFDTEGLYVWHCHILEHEDNEMMLPFFVGDAANSPVPVAQ